jgi:lysophospholipase L1-like esterase
MTTKKLIFIVLAIICVVIAFYFFLGQNENIANYPPKNQTIVAFGDSLVEGVGSTLGNDFVSKLESDLGIEIINKGRSGDTTTSALSRTNEVLALNPGIVMILLGGNDVLRRIPKEETFKNLSVMIENFQNNGAVVLLLGVRGGILFDGYEEDYENLSKKYHTAYVSNVLEDLITNPKYMSDAIHPNDQGYALIAKRIAPVLEKILR